MNNEIPYSIFEQERLVLTRELSALHLPANTQCRILAYLPEQFYKEEQKAQILKVFAACGTQESDVLILNQPFRWSDIKDMPTLKEVFLFGADPRSLDISYILYPYKFLPIGDKKVILADPLPHIMGNAALKSDFWHKCLRPYYLGK